MRHFTLALICVVFLACTTVAQQSAAEVPATKQDIERYLEVTQTRTMFKQMMESMSGPMHQMVQQQCAQSKEHPIPDCEATLNKMIDSMLAEMPFNEMIDAMVPVYQKYLSKTDVDALIAFQLSPVGQKMSRQAPQMMSDAMAVVMPIVQDYSRKMSERLQREMMAKFGAEGSTPGAQSQGRDHSK